MLQTQTTTALTQKPDTLTIPLKDILIDETYQRAPAMARVKQIAKAFNGQACSFPLANVREDGNIYVIDGQHRLLAMKTRGISEWPFHVVYGLTQEEEARLYKEKNTHIKRVSVLDQYRADLVIGDETALKIEATLKSLGLYIPNIAIPQGPNSVVSVGSLFRIYRSGGERRLYQVLSLAKCTWPNNNRAFMQTLLQGINNFIEKYPQMKESRFIEKVGLLDPQVLHSRARQLTLIGGGRAETNLVQILRGTYNAHLKVESKLPES